MTLVMAFIGERGAAMAGDMREITFLGEPASIAVIEKELYGGDLATDDDLLARAKELGVELGIRDDKVKVTGRSGALVGEVTSLEGGVLRSRRVYATAGSYLIVDLGEGLPVLRGKGGAGNFVVLGNDRTKAIAKVCIRERWKGGGLREAVEILAGALGEAAEGTASVSRRFILVQSGERADLGRVMEGDGIPGPTGRPGSEGDGAVPGGWGPLGPSRERPGG
jgi:hypothetical protein